MNADVRVIYEKEEDIAIIRVVNPPVNTLTPAVRRLLIAALAESRASSTVRASILLEGRGFIAGADLEELDSGVQSPDLWDLTQALEEGSKPVIAALHGFALGGGLAVALACDRRVAAVGCIVGFPEVSLGLIPSFGATQYLSRIVGVEVALDLVTSGRRINETEAKDLGLVDEVTTVDKLLSSAKAAAREILANGKVRRPVGTRSVTPDINLQSLIANAISAVIPEQLTARAQLAGIEAVGAAQTMPLERGVKREAELQAELMLSPESNELRRRFREGRARRQNR
jgi:3-hydroxyacyl-CoA dehydrogenase